MNELIGLFLSAFLAATLLPIPSEGVLAALASSDGAELAVLIAVATVGNTLGGAANYVLGRFAMRWRDRRYFPLSRKARVGATRCMRRHGRWLLLLAWVPIVGDPLTFAAGLLRVPFGWFLPLVAIGKAARYVVVVAVTRAVV